MPTLFDKIINEDALEFAYRKTQKGKAKYKAEALKFSLDETYNLMELRQSLIEETYQFGGYTEFKVYEPKERIINAPRYKDKIVQIALNEVLKEVYYPKFIYDSYSCIDLKGTHKCADRIQTFMRRAHYFYGDSAQVVKIDISKFFYTINRKLLKQELTSTISCQKTLRLLFKIIDSADIIDLLGLPLGNTLSQISANIYMNKTDQFAKRRLSVKYYVRYADDLIIILPNKLEADRVLSEMIRFLNIELELNANANKTKSFPLSQGINSIGYKIQPTHKLLRNDSKKRIKRKAKAIPSLIADGKITKEKAEQMLNSWKGHAEHANSKNFIDRMIERCGYIYLDHKGNLKIKENEL